MAPVLPTSTRMLTPMEDQAVRVALVLVVVSVAAAVTTMTAALESSGAVRWK